MRIHYLQHVPFEGLGHIAEWADAHGHPVSKTALYADEPLPKPDLFDLLIVMGGPMGVHDTVLHPWLIKEKYFIEAALRAEKHVLGICLGAQLMADVLGARVYPNRHKEIGWHPVSRGAAVHGTEWAKIIPSRFDAFHWHGDTFDLPSGAAHLVRSEACRHQAFFHPPCALGLQFHLESTPESIDLLIRHCGHELTEAPYIQGEARIRAQKDKIPESNALMGKMLDFFLHRKCCPVS